MGDDDRPKDGGDPQDDKMEKSTIGKRIYTGEPDPEGRAGSESEPSDDFDEAEFDEELIQKSMRRAAKADENEKTFFVWRDGEWVEVPNVFYRQRMLAE